MRFVFFGLFYTYFRIRFSYLIRRKKPLDKVRSFVSSSSTVIDNEMTVFVTNCHCLNETVANWEKAFLFLKKEIMFMTLLKMRYECLREKCINVNSRESKAILSDVICFIVTLMQYKCMV